jgi:hypothetical protein
VETANFGNAFIQAAQDEELIGTEVAGTYGSLD